MNRNFTPDEKLIDRLLLDDTTAFEELHHRYCFSLYQYCAGKLKSPEDAKRIVRDLFISIWDQRHSLPVDFSISYYLYTEVRKAVVKCLNEKAKDNSATELIEKEILPGFSVAELLKARQPVQPKTEMFATSNNKHIHEEQLWVHSYFTATRLSNLKKSFRSMLNIF
jgi:DNA-directed RNA polymerase specialized sigma24 family protein